MVRQPNFRTNRRAAPRVTSISFFFLLGDAPNATLCFLEPRGLYFLTVLSHWRGCAFVGFPLNNVRHLIDLTLSNDSLPPTRPN